MVARFHTEWLVAISVLTDCAVVCLVRQYCDIYRVCLNFLSAPLCGLAVVFYLSESSATDCDVDPYGRS